MAEELPSVLKLMECMVVKYNLSSGRRCPGGEGKGPCAKDVVFGDGAASCLPRFLTLGPGGGEVLVSQIKSKSVW